MDKKTTSNRDPSIDQVDGKLQEITNSVEKLSQEISTLNEVDLSEAEGETLSTVRKALRELETETEEARKEEVEDEMDSRAAPGESVGEATRIEGHRKYIIDEEAARSALLETGIDPQEVMEFNTTELAEIAVKVGIDTETLIGRRTYTYWK